MKKGIIKSEKFELQYSTEGFGKNNILVIGSAVYYPRTFSNNLRNYFKLVFIDHRGFAKCDDECNKTDFELDAILDDVEKVRSKLGLGTVVIIGHSGHGYMALEYAKKYSNNVSKVILIAMGPSTSSKYHKLAEDFFNKRASTERKTAQSKALETLDDDIKANPDKRFITFCLKQGPRSWYNYNYDASSLWDGVKVNMPAFDYLWGEVFANIDITEGLDNLNIPVLLLLGEHDYIVAPYYTWDWIIDKFKNFKMKLFDKGSHTPQLDCPDQFDAELIKFIDE